MSNTKTIAKNSGWFGIEMAFDAVLTIVTSIAIARILGPTRQGHLVYVTWVASVVSGLGALGLPTTTRKYMAEFLGKGDKGTARYIYLTTFLLQCAFATLATLGLVVWVLYSSEPDYKIASLLIVLSIWPSMVNLISSQANVAAEDMAKNLPASATSMLSYSLLIGATIYFHWGVVGVGAATFTMRFVDFIVRAVPTMTRILKWSSEHHQPEDLRERMIKFAWQSLAILALELVVWQRSEFVLLKHLSADIRQIAFYSVAFSMADRLLITAAIFGQSAGATIFAQYGRDKSRLPDIAASAFRYLALSTIPIHFIAAALAGPALLLLYGQQYVGAYAVITVAPLFCMPKAFLVPIRSLLQSHERQELVIWSTIIASVFDLGTAALLIPKLGAVGACIGSGVGEITCVGGMWMLGISFFKVRLPWKLIGKVVLISTVASLSAHYVAIMFSPLVGIIAGGFVAMAILLGLFYVLRVLQPEDGSRLNVIAGSLPKPVKVPFNKFLGILVRPAFAK
jgi:Membrane protein involved in the export of O-antigen and teichoic acid